MNKKIKVLVVEHSLPFFHVPAWVEVARHPAIDLTVAFGRGFFTGEKGVPEGEVNPEMGFKTIVEPSIVRKFAGQSVLWHTAALNELRENHYDVVIQQFETKMVSMWKIRGIQRKRGGKFILWGIGESLKPTPVLDMIRRHLARTADAMVFYADANRRRYAQMGIEAEKLYVARNLIDISPIKKAAKQWDAKLLASFKEKHGLGSGPVLLSVGRLLYRKRMDMVIAAGEKLRTEFPDLKVVLVGDGPEMDNLHKAVQDAGMQEVVHFTGKISDEMKVAPWFLVADLVVAPGQIGHLATHAHAYGVPLVVADDKSVQGPEIEILLSGETGQTYQYDDIESLALTIRELLINKEQRNSMAEKAIKRADEFCSIEEMASGFINAILYTINRGAKA